MLRRVQLSSEPERTIISNIPYMEACHMSVLLNIPFHKELRLGIRWQENDTGLLVLRRRRCVFYYFIERSDPRAYWKRQLW